MFLVGCFGLASTTWAESCWRNTTCTGPVDSAFPGPWEVNNYAPASRNVIPLYVLSSADIRSNFSGQASLNADNTLVVLDFGKEVGGIIRFDYMPTAPASIGLAFTEAKNWIGKNSDSSNGGTTPDNAIYAKATAARGGSYVMPDVYLRGGFRYLTLFLSNTNASVNITNIVCEIAFQPTWSNLQAYSGYFHSSDQELNKIWYSGAYTLQTNAVPTDTGRQVPFLSNTWANDAVLGPGVEVIVDGAKRDRAVWPGDMGVAVPSTFVSIGDLEAVKNALQVIYDYQNPDGSFPEAGPPLLQQGSDTYHMWTMIGTYNYMLYSNDTTFFKRNWPAYIDAMNYIYSKVLSGSGDGGGLLNVTGTRDWARIATNGNTTQANIILYHTLTTAALLFAWYPIDIPFTHPLTGNIVPTFISRAASLRNAIQTHCWDPTAHAFRDNATTTTLYPQDANSLAILFGLTNRTQSLAISASLTRNWTPIGPEPPELPQNISPFITSLEIQAHFEADRADRALDLIRRTWGWYLKNPNGTESTVIEGYRTDGSFGYRFNRGYPNPSYTSHAHGWSSGPTSALTEYVVGLRVVGPAGQRWRLRPQFGDLEWCEGGFTTSLGKYQAKWNRTAGAEYSLSYYAPE
ncbi:hypothetical protein LTS18_003772, partial [Coniosporium uncinatum]